MNETDTGRILLVDHSRGALLIQETLLRRRDMSVMTALGGSEGLVKARMERPNLIVFGYDLFDMTAPEFCREIRADELTRMTSLLLICDDQEHGDLCLSAGCNDVVYQPVKRPELDRKIEKLTRIPIRRQLRTMTKIELSLEKDGRFILGRSVNISSSGMLIEADRVLSQNEPVRIHFYLPGDPKPLQIPAQILRAEFSGSMAKYGVAFLEMSEGERERIDRFVHRLRSRELI